MIYGRLGWPTGYPNTSASLGVLGFWTLVGVGAERALAWPARSLALGAAVPALGFALLTQSRGAAFTLLLVAPFAIALVRERLRLTAFLLVALAGLLPALPALRTAVDLGTAASAGTAASRLLLGGVIVAVLAARSRSPISASRSRRRAVGCSAALRRWRSRSPPCSDRVAVQQDAPRRIRSAWHSFTLVDAQSDAGPHLLSAESNRWDFWEVAAGDLAARPLNGFGAGSFGPTYLRDGRSGEMPAQAHGQLQELAATLGLPGLLLGCAVGAIGLAGLLLRRQGAVNGPRRRRCRHCVRARARAGRLALAGAGGRAARRGAARVRRRAASARPRVPRRAARIGGGVVLALGLLWVLPGFAAERLRERAIDNDDPAAARLRQISPFDPAPLRLAAQLEPPARGLEDALAAARRAPREWSSWALVAQLAGDDQALVARACARARAENPRLTDCS